LARSFYFILYQFLRYKYDNVEVVFISHSTDAKEVSEEDFFQRATMGGTVISSALALEQEIIQKRYHPSSWNIYTFYSGDGENWSFDNPKAVSIFEKLKQLSQMVCYAEISPQSSLSDPFAGSFNFGGNNPGLSGDNLWHALIPLVGEAFKLVKINKSSQIWPAFQVMFGGKT